MESIKKLLSGIGLMILGIASFQLAIVTDWTLFNIIGIIVILVGIVYFIAGLRE